MIDDSDAMWKPGFPPAAPAAERTAADRSPIDRSPAEPSPAPGLPDRFRPAVRRSPASRPPSATAPSPITDTDAARDLAGPEIVAPAGWVVERDEQPAGRPRRPWRTAALAVLAVVALVVVAAVVAGSIGDDPDPRRPGELAGTDVRRLPAGVDELWSTTLAGTGSAIASSIVVDGRDTVVVVVDDGSRNRSSVVGLDAMSGEIRWRRSFSFAPPEVSFLGVFDDVVLLEQTDPVNRRLIALSTLDGETAWERRIGGTSFSAVLLGTGLVANFSTEVPDRTTFYDPATGEPVGEVFGAAATTDLDGTWYFTRDQDVLAVDLSDGWTEPVVLVEDGPATVGLIAVVDERILVVDPNGQLRELVPGADRLVPLGGDELPEITTIFPAGGSSVVAANGGEIFGVELGDDGVRSTWNRAAAMRSFALTERGMVLSVSDAGIGFSDATDLVVIDGLTGERLAGAGAVNGAEKLPLIAGDGFVTVTEVVEGDERRGFDLDGNELWRVVVAGRVRVGDELVVVLDNTDSGYRVTAYGSPAG